MDTMTEKKVWEEYIPSYVSLYYIDRGSSLDGETDLLQECLERNELFPISEKIDDWWDYPEGPYMDEIKGKMEDDGLGDEFEESFEEIREALWAKDDSDPVGELLDKTEVNLYYDLGLWVPDIYWDPDPDKAADYWTEKVMDRLGLDKKNEGLKDEIRTMVLQGCGAYLRIYWGGDIRKFINHEGTKDPKKDFRTISFKGNFLVALVNPTEGSGDRLWDTPLDVKYTFSRENLRVSKTDRYSMEDIWDNVIIREGGEPTVSTQYEKKAKRVGESVASKLRAREKEYEKTFKAGSCTFGDTKYSRHRDVYYRNDYPCGHVCPHCGQFWID